MTVRVLIADDEDLIRSGLRLILESEADIAVVGEAANGVEAVLAARRLRPDVVLMDVQMPLKSGIAATGEIAASGREGSPRVIILTTFELDEFVYEALRAGASGFLLKRTPAADLVSAVRAVAAGDALLSPSITRRLLDRFARQAPPPAGPSPLAALTGREGEVFQLMTQGLSNAEIAERLALSEGTVKTHAKHIFDKLDIRDRTQAVILAYELGVVRPRGG